MSWGILFFARASVAVGGPLSEIDSMVSFGCQALHLVPLCCTAGRHSRLTTHKFLEGWTETSAQYVDKEATMSHKESIAL